MLKSSEVFSHYGSRHTVSLRSFLLLVSLFVFYGLAGTAVIANYMMHTDFTPGWGSIIVLGLVIPIAGIFVAQSDNWMVSFVGYNMVLIPFGVILGPALKDFDPALIRDVAGMTAAITIGMGIAGLLLPQFFSKIGGVLFVVLSLLLLVRIVGLFVPAINDFTLIDYIGAGLFSLYVGYDMHRATRVERTTDNAVDIAISLYLDIINLFLELLKIMGDSDD